MSEEIKKMFSEYESDLATIKIGTDLLESKIIEETNRYLIKKLNKMLPSGYDVSLSKVELPDIGSNMEKPGIELYLKRNGEHPSENFSNEELGEKILSLIEEFKSTYNMNVYFPAYYYHK